MNPEVKEYSNEKQRIKAIIIGEIKEYKNNLVRVKGYIEEKFHKPLSFVDDAYIERKYMKYCSEFWIQEIIDFLKRSTDSKSCIFSQEIFSSLDSIESLSNIPNFFKQLEYYKLLIEHYPLVSKKNEKILISRFKKEYLEQTAAYTDYAEKELLFLETFLDFLSISTNLQSIIAELELEDFCCGKLSFHEFLKKIVDLDVSTYGANLAALQEVAKCLQQENDLFLIDKFKEVIGAYLKPVRIQERKTDDRLVIEVRGKNVVVSEILWRLENNLSKNSNVEEVRFVGADVIHIDSNLKSEVWHGRNIAVLTKAIKVHDKVTWNVSGEDNNHSYSSNAGTGKDSHGKQGKDGYPGESGGNVLILVEKIENPENFTIISNGGKGSKGQDGGNGKDGKDGESITKEEFKEKFPPIADFGSGSIWRGGTIKKILNNITNDLLRVKTVWYTGANTATIEGIIIDIEDIESSNATTCKIVGDSGNLPLLRSFEQNFFIETVTRRGCEITFSFEYGDIWRRTVRQAFFLYKGSLGQPGGHGGEYGLGGHGGYAGDIIVRNLKNSDQKFGIMKCTKQGEKGENGRGGLYGRHGRNGWDMGYLDYQCWKKPKFRYEGQYIVEYYDQDNNPSDRVWCPYKNKYAGIVVPNIEQQKQQEYERKKNTRQNIDRENHAQAVRKRNILQGSVLASYSHNLSSIEKSTLQDLRLDLENIKQRALQTNIENQEQQKDQTMELEIKRHISFVHQDKNEPCNDAIPSADYKDTTNIDNLIDKLKGEPQLLDNWLQLRGIELIRSELNDLFSNFETVKQKSLEEQGPRSGIENKLKDIEQLLIDKYRLATLQEIAKQLSPYQEVTDNVELTTETAVRYLVEEKEKDNNIFHPILETLNQYLYENSKKQREKISKFCEEELQNTNETREILTRSLETFIFEVGKSEEAHLCVKKYYDEYKEYLNEEKQSLNISCDQDVLKEYYKYIQEKGSLSKSYRELLAYVFNINIRLYTEDQDNGLSLQENHNSLSKKTIHVLYKADELIQLNINKNYLRLEKERKKKDNLYAKILIEIESLKQKQKFDDYLKNKAFLADGVISENKQYFEEEDIKKIIENFNWDGKQQQLKTRLEKITFQYIGQQGILHNILKRFSSDGKHVSYQELCYIINSILIFSIEGRKEQNTFSWIVAAHSQRNWIDELILLQIENHFKKQLEEKSKWRDYLSKIVNKDVLLLFGVKLEQGGSISIQCIEDTLYLLSNIPKETVNLEGLELSEWPYVLKEKYWLYKLLPLTNWQKSEKLPTASYYLLSIENTFGTDLVEKLLGALNEKEQKLSPDVLTNIIFNFYDEKWNLSEEELETLPNCTISKWTQKMQQKFIGDKRERDITQLVTLIKGNGNTSKGIVDDLLKIANSIKSICDENYVVGGKSVSNFTEINIEHWAKEFRSNSVNKGKQDIEKEMLAIIDRAIELKRGFKLRDTQRLTVLTLLTNDHNTLAQVSTGEGKSLIVVAASLMKALHGEKVDIITSSPVLAKRDAEVNKDIYNMFGINVSHNCSEDIETRKEVYSTNQIIYGDLSNFQRDYLLDRFYGKNILGNHNFVNVIVDEVDSMLLDKGNNMLYLSHDLAGLDKLESVYIYIWQWINRPATDYKEISYAFDVKAIKEAVLNDLYGSVTKEDIGKLGSKLSEQHKSIIWERLFTAKILDSQGKLLKENIDDEKLNEILLPEFSSYKNRLSHLLNECIERERFIRVPNYLRSFVEKHLESWINNAITAFFMNAGQDYVVDVDRTGTSPDRNPNITILDRDTGTDQTNSQWDEALHQFLQLKHGCKLSLQSLKAVFTSNISFFKLYSNLYGLTGTLGSKRERDLLRKIHNVDFVTIPTAKPKQFQEGKPILCTSKKEWINQICNEMRKLVEKEERSVLIICETVNDVEVLHEAFGRKNEKHVHTYIRDYEELDIIQGDKRLEQGQIIIATNLAGRGTDIKITDGLRTAGGLHVCLTYLPNNIRIEQQAFGRAARSGDNGSGQLIIMDLKGQEYSNSRVLDLKKERDAEELRRISDITAYYETQITIEEDCFKAFKEQYEQLKNDLDDKTVPTEVKEILLHSCLDKWAFWLDENGKCIKNLTDEQSKRNFKSLLNKFISQFKNSDIRNSEKWLSFVEGNPVQMVKLGKYLSQNEKHTNALENAIELYYKVIKNEPYFSEAAHYYKAFALAKKIDWEQRPMEGENKQTLKEFKEELRKAARLFDVHSKFAMNAAGIIGKIKKNNTDSIIQIDAYEEQKKNVANLYYTFSRSIDDIFGHIITPQSFVNYDINDELAGNLYKDLLENGILKKPKVRKNISEEKLKTISSGYGVSVETLKNFLSGHQEINEKEFRKALKKAVPLPSREEFWKLLIQEGVLSKEVKYVVVDNERLKEIDLLLMDFLIEKVDKKELKKQSLEHNNKQILLNVEWISQQKNSDNIFKKDDFIKIVGEDKYKILKEKRVFSFNKKANINPSKIESAVFSCYDSITIEDFINQANITKSEAEKILVELVEQKVLMKKDNSENSAYRLKIKFDQIRQVQLISCPVYENAVRGLLSVCFTYRIFLQKIVKQLEEKEFPIRLQLTIKPHQKLVLELLEQKIIRPTTVTTENENLEEKLKNIYSQTMTKHNFKLMLSQDKLIPEEYTEKLFNCLIQKEWLVQCNPIQSVQYEGIGIINKENIENLAESLMGDILYRINRPDKRQISLNFSPDGSHENVLIKSQSIDKTVKKVLDNRLHLTKKDTINNIVSTLKRSRSLLKALKVPASKLKSLTEFYDKSKAANIEEMRVFFLNGLDQLLQLEEEKWTKEMLFNTAGVIAIGIIQIAIGAAIELYAVGAMTHVGNAFINEGVNDLIFAAGALKSGYFSWEDYRRHKLESLMITATTVGVGAYLSKGTKLSRYGHKLAGPNFEYGMKIAEMSGNRLIETVGWKVVLKEVAKRIALKAGKDIVDGLINAGVHTIVGNNFQVLCENIASDILSNIEQEVEKHNISISLERAYKTLGEEGARKMVNDLTNNVLAEQNCAEKFLPIANKIASGVSQGIAEAVGKGSEISSMLTLSTHIISQGIIWSERGIHIANIRTITGNLLDNLDKKIREKLDNMQGQHAEQGSLNQEQEGYEEFKKQMIYQWKSLLREKAGRVVSQYVVTPILKKIANDLVQYVGKKMQEAYQSYKESGYLERFKELKQEYQEELQSRQRHGNRLTVEDDITKKYHKNLRQLMIKTNNPDLLADIVRENVPMNMTCVDACTQVLHKILKEPLTIIVEGDNGIRQKFSSASDEAEGRIIKLALQNNHFQLYGSGASESNSVGNSKNNCLYEALAEAIPQIRNVMTQERFRDRVANCIQHDKGIRYHIQQGWHQLPISLGAFGGATERKKTELAHDFESSSFDNEGDYNQYRYRVRNISNHFQARFYRYLRLGGFIQKISNETKVTRCEVVKPGKSRHQDQHSNRGPEIHASHPVRLGEINPEIEQFETLRKKLANFLGHTQNVPKWANVWHGIGGDMDRYQEDNLKILNGIDFDRSRPTRVDVIRLKKMKDSFLAILDMEINKDGLGETEKMALINTRTAITKTTIQSMYEYGKAGLSGEIMNPYR
ncbi:uncharacterized protein LOC116426667 isoform X1 [Nomia melanderi]|uniref:uncharacterized protein LOC116426667 isoform X1 n=1 Tax=Nomia melanderi TaxID=2448451 RepID=UPI003FCE1A45